MMHFPATYDDFLTACSKNNTNDSLLTVYSSKNNNERLPALRGAEGKTVGLCSGLEAADKVLVAALSAELLRQLHETSRRDIDRHTRCVLTRTGTVLARPPDMRRAQAVLRRRFEIVAVRR